MSLLSEDISIRKHHEIALTLLLAANRKKWKEGDRRAPPTQEYASRSGHRAPWDLLCKIMPFSRELMHRTAKRLYILICYVEHNLLGRRLDVQHQLHLPWRCTLVIREPNVVTLKPQGCLSNHKYGFLVPASVRCLELFATFPIPEQFLLCGRVHTPAEGGNCHHQEVLLSWGGVVDLQQCLDGWCMSSGSHMDARIQAFIAEYCAVKRWSVLFTSPVSPSNVVLISVYFFMFQVQPGPIHCWQ